MSSGCARPLLPPQLRALNEVDFGPRLSVPFLSARSPPCLCVTRSGQEQLRRTRLLQYAAAPTERAACCS